jgi:hypothetical protein
VFPSTVTDGGAVIVGGVVSTTVMINDAELVWPALSVAVQVTIVTPNGKTEPEGGLHVGVSNPSSTSSAVTEYVTTAPDGEVASQTNLKSGDIIIVGGTSVSPIANELAGNTRIAAIVAITLICNAALVLRLMILSRATDLLLCKIIYDHM